MKNMINELIALQSKIRQHANSESENDFVVSDALFFMPQGNLFDVIYRGFGYDFPNRSLDEIQNSYSGYYAFASVLDFLSRAEIAARIRSLTFDGDDEGANGTKTWCFNRLIESGVTFPNLTFFKVQLTRPGDHNTNIIEERPGSFEEGGRIAQLIAKMPVLRCLEVPSAPDRSFFEMGPLPLNSLTVQAGYDHQNFIDNMAESDCFPNLQALNYSDYMHVFSDMAGKETQFSSYKNFFESKMISEKPGFHFTLQYSILTRQQLSALMSIEDNWNKKKKEVQFLHIDVHPTEYIEPNPYWH